MLHGKLKNKRFKKAQSTLELALAIIIVMIFFLGSLAVWRAVNSQIASQTESSGSGSGGSGGSGGGSGGSGGSGGGGGGGGRGRGGRQAD